MYPSFFPGSPVRESLLPLTLAPNFPGVGLGAYRDPPRVLLDNCGPANDGRPAGVDIKVGAFRKGDSGLGRDGRDLGFICGLAALPGPTDWLNFDIAGVGGVYVLLSARPPILKLPSEGVVGVGGNDPDDRVGEARFEARLRGRKIPAPGTEVLKYRILVSQRLGCSMVYNGFDHAVALPLDWKVGLTHQHRHHSSL